MAKPRADGLVVGLRVTTDVGGSRALGDFAQPTLQFEALVVWLKGGYPPLGTVGQAGARVSSVPGSLKGAPCYLPWLP